MRNLLRLILFVWLLFLMLNSIPKLYNAVVSCSTLMPTILVKKKKRMKKIKEIPVYLAKVYQNNRDSIK